MPTSILAEDVKIFKTEDTSIFRSITGNRKLNKNHVQRLIAAIGKDTKCVRYNPILVNEKMEVIDGQHRLEAIKRLNLPVYFIREMGLTLPNVQDLNSMTKPWSPLDYAYSFIERGNDNYQHYVDFKESYGLNHDVLVRFLTLGSFCSMEEFRNGKLQVIDLNKSIDLCEKLLQLGKYHSRYNIRPCAFAFKRIWEHPEYDHERMLMKLTQFKHKLEGYSLENDYCRAFEEIYNHALPESKKLRFI